MRGCGPLPQESSPGGADTVGGINASPGSARPELLNTFLQHVAPGHSWTSLAVHVNYELPVHKDLGSGPLPNAVVALSHFEGGELWLEDSSGHVYQDDQHGLRRGTVFSLHGATTFFHSHAVAHCTLRSTRFDRLTLVAYTVRNFLHLGQHWRQALNNIGFMLPEEGALAKPTEPRLLPPILY